MAGGHGRKYWAGWPTISAARSIRLEAGGFRRPLLSLTTARHRKYGSTAPVAPSTYCDAVLCQSSLSAICTLEGLLRFLDTLTGPFSAEASRVDWPPCRSSSASFRHNDHRHVRRMLESCGGLCGTAVWGRASERAIGNRAETRSAFNPVAIVVERTCVTLKNTLPTPRERRSACVILEVVLRDEPVDVTETT